MAPLTELSVDELDGQVVELLPARQLMAKIKLNALKLVKLKVKL
ncbi:MAG: hypothetical protein ACRD0Q_02445 [Acidimicrobiales bacterium]